MTNGDTPVNLKYVHGHPHGPHLRHADGRPIVGFIPMVTTPVPVDPPEPDEDDK